MSGEIVLCKFVLVDDNTDSNESGNTECINYKMKNWKLPIGFEKDRQIFQDIADGDKAMKFLRFLEANDSELILSYRTTYNGCGGYINEKSLAEKLFMILFEGYSNLPNQMAINDKQKMPWTVATLKLYEVLQRKHTNYEKTINCPYANKDFLLPKKFLPTLCDYQKRTVRWLLYREQHMVSLPPFFLELKNKLNHSIIYKHMYAMHLIQLPPGNIILPAGGILAEEMGLGKTVEILALILLHPRPDHQITTNMEKVIRKMIAKRKRTEKRVFCICPSKSDKDIIDCAKCGLGQHRSCILYSDSNLNHKLTSDSTYICPSCWYSFMNENKPNNNLIQTKATFILTPNVIKLQWLAEIHRHIQPTLKVCLYNGIANGKWISPLQLAAYDIVLTDFNTLRNDIYFTGENKTDRISRHQPQRMRIHTPLLMLDWWRVCLDEAQMIGVTSNVFALVRMLPAINRWVITGTPIQKSLNDLQPLLKFIGFEEAAEASTWKNLVEDFISQNENEDVKNLENVQLINLLQKCMRRTNKLEINHELNIPEQTTIVHRIDFNNLEKFFYCEQHNAHREQFLLNVMKFKRTLATLSPELMNKILQPFLKVRQSCTMPCVLSMRHYTSSSSSSSSSNQHAQAQTQKQFLHLKDLHEYLKSSNELECKSELRCMASSYNGLAALYFLQEHYDTSLKHYKSVLRLAKDYTDINVTVDSLLQIHALHNLIQIQSIKNGNIPQMDLEELQGYQEQCNTLEWKYLHTYANTVAAVRQSYETTLNTMKENQIDDFLRFLAEHLNKLNAHKDTQLLQKVTDDCAARFGLLYPELRNIVSCKSLLYVLDGWWKKIQATFQQIVRSFNKLRYFIENIKARDQVDSQIWENITKLVRSCYECHLQEFRQMNSEKKQKTGNTKNKCVMCNLRDTINKFECLLYLKILTENTNATDGMDQASFELTLLKVTCQFFKAKTNQMLSSATDYKYLDKILQYFENCQLLCKRAIKYWIEIEFAIKAYDELDMCKMRITITDNKQEVSNFNILECTLPQHIFEFEQELYSAQRSFSSKLARLKYIRHLEKDTDEGNLCPICRLSDSDQYVVLECGHHICFPCMKRLQAYVKGIFIQCSICRHTQIARDVFYVSRSLNKQQNSEIEINGNYTAKIAYLVRLILKLKMEKDKQEENDNDNENENENENEKESISRKDRQLKIVIFTQWEPILLAIATALKDNNIQYRCKCTPKNIEDFKNPVLDVTCLLMLFSKGAQGLNLIEATHVFVVEPTLNPGAEMQAIGRIHRFGQTRTTTVHYFIVNGTIEENIYNYLKSIKSQDSSCIDSNWEANNMALETFVDLFNILEL